MWIEQEVYDREGLRRAHNLLRVKLRERKRTDFVWMNDSKKTSLMRGERLIYYYSLDGVVLALGPMTYKVSFQQEATKTCSCFPLASPLFLTFNKKLRPRMSESFTT